MSFFLPTKNNVTDIHIHDTYFVLANTHIFQAAAAVCFFIWLLYLAANKILYSLKLTWVHLAVTLSALAVIAFMINTPVGEIAFIVFIAAQLIFAVNFLTGLFKPNKNVSEPAAGK